MWDFLAVGAGGFIGAASRYGLGTWVRAATATRPFPYSTLTVNVLGSFVLGLVFYFCHTQGCSRAPVREFVLIGMLGAFTTFSTFSLETVDLLMEGNRALGAANVAANVGFCLLGVLAARLLGQIIWG